jgi:hypothetical protein
METYIPWANRTIADHRNRLIRIDSWLHGCADSFGACDACGGCSLALWVDIDTAKENERNRVDDVCNYCRQCWEERRATIKAKIATMLAEMEGVRCES